jgi:hypothetical protein
MGQHHFESLGLESGSQHLPAGGVTIDDQNPDPAIGNRSDWLG